MIFSILNNYSITFDTSAHRLHFPLALHMVINKIFKELLVWLWCSLNISVIYFHYFWGVCNYISGLLILRLFSSYFMPPAQFLNLSMGRLFIVSLFFFWPTFNTQFQSLSVAHAALTEYDGPTVLPRVVTDKALWYSVSWKHLLPIRYKPAGSPGHEENGKVETAIPGKSYDNIWILGGMAPFKNPPTT